VTRCCEGRSSLARHARSTARRFRGNDNELVKIAIEWACQRGLTFDCGMDEEGVDQTKGGERSRTMATPSQPDARREADRGRGAGEIDPVRLPPKHRCFAINVHLSQ